MSNDSEEEVLFAPNAFDRRNCLVAALSPASASLEDSSPPLSFSDDHSVYQLSARSVRARLAVNHRVRDGLVVADEERRESEDSFAALEDDDEEQDVSGDGSPAVQGGPLTQTLPNQQYRVRRVVGSSHRGAFL